MTGIRKIFPTIVTSLILFSGTYFSSSAQYTFLDAFINNELSPKGCKWGFNQNWNAISNSWADTNGLFISTINNSGYPTESIYKTKNEEGVFVDVEKVVMTYENNRLKTMTEYMYLPDSGKYSGYGVLATFTWTSDSVLQKIDFETSLLFYINLMEQMGDTIPNLAMILPYIKSAKTIGVNTFTVENGKIIAELAQARISGLNSTAMMIAKPLLDSMGVVSDTNMTDVSKATYSYGTNYRVSKKYQWIDNLNDWAEMDKDSAIFQNNRHSGTFYSLLDPFNGVYLLYGKDSILYNEQGSLKETIYSEYIENTWVNSVRSVYMYTPYEPAATKKSVVSSTGMNAIIQSESRKPVVSLHLDKQGTISYQIADMKGRILSRAINMKLSAGNHTLPLNVAAPGNYIVSLKSKAGLFSLPFRVLR